MLSLLLLLNPARAGCMPLSLDEVVEQAKVLMSQVEPGLALGRVDEAIASLPCRTELITAEALSHLYQTGGTAARQAGDEARRHDLYARAAAMAFPVAYYEVLGDGDRDYYQDLLAARPKPPTAWVVVRSPISLDGYPVGTRGEQGVVAGEHLVQILEADGARSSTLVPVAVGGHVPVGAAGSAEPAAGGSKGARTGLALAGTGLVVAGAGALIEGSQWLEALGENRGRDEVRSQIGSAWPDSTEDTAHRRTTALAWTIGGLATMTVGVALLDGALVVSNNSITFVKTW